MILLTDFKSGKSIMVNPAFICTMQSVLERPVDEDTGHVLFLSTAPDKRGSIITFVMTSGVAKVKESLDEIQKLIDGRVL